MTTLQLARLVANAARASDDVGAAMAVLEELRANGAWFSRGYETHDGCDVEVLYKPLSASTDRNRRLGRAYRKRETAPPLRLTFGDE